MAKKGKELNPYSLGFAQVVAVAETDEQAENDYAPHMDYFYNRCLHVYNGFADAPGYRTVSTIRAGVLGQVGEHAALRREGLTWKDFLDQGYVIAGSPKTVRERLREAMKTLNCGHLMILQQIGSMPPELVRKNTSCSRPRSCRTCATCGATSKTDGRPSASCRKPTSPCRPTSISRRPRPTARCAHPRRASAEARSAK